VVRRARGRAQPATFQRHWFCEQGHLLEDGRGEYEELELDPTIGDDGGAAAAMLALLLAMAPLAQVKPKPFPFEPSYSGPCKFLWRSSSSSQPIRPTLPPAGTRRYPARAPAGR